MAHAERVLRPPIILVGSLFLKFDRLLVGFFLRGPFLLGIYWTGRDNRNGSWTPNHRRLGRRSARRRRRSGSWLLIGRGTGSARWRHNLSRQISGAVLSGHARRKDGQAEDRAEQQESRFHRSASIASHTKGGRARRKWLPQV